MAGGEDTRNHPRRKPTRNLEDPMERLREERSRCVPYGPNRAGDDDEDTEEDGGYWWYMYNRESKN